MYKNYKRHAEHCPHCSPGRLRQIAAAERADKENRLSATAETESSQNADTPPPRQRRGQLIHLLTYPLSFTALCSAEVEQQPWARWAVDKGELHHYTGMSVADVERVYEASKEKLLALAAQQHHPNANTPTLTSHNLLAITLHWLRRKPTYNELSHLYPHSGFFWHLMVRKVVAALDGCISSRFVPSLASNAPTAVRFPNVKIIVDTTFVPLPKTPFIPADYHKKSPTKAAWK